MKIGTKSVLFGVHCFFLHPWFVAWAWWRLYGFPLDPRLWVAFFVHDLGYLGKPDMDGLEGESHPQLGARIMSALFDWNVSPGDGRVILCGRKDKIVIVGKWGQFCLFHSRYYAKNYLASYSRLCVADKLAFVLTPRWLYLPMARATGELSEYLKNAQRAESDHWKPTGYDARVWHAALAVYMNKWVEEHRDGRDDKWTSADRHARDASGVWQ